MCDGQVPLQKEAHYMTVLLALHAVHCLMWGICPVVAAMCVVSILVAASCVPTAPTDTIIMQITGESTCGGSIGMLPGALLWFQLLHLLSLLWQTLLNLPHFLLSLPSCTNLFSSRSSCWRYPPLCTRGGQCHHSGTNCLNRRVGIHSSRSPGGCCLGSSVCHASWTLQRWNEATYGVCPKWHTPIRLHR